MASNTQLVQTGQKFHSRYSFGNNREGYRPNFTIINGNDTTNSPVLKMFGSYLTEMRKFHVELLEAIQKLNDVTAVNTTYTKEIKELENKKKDDGKNANNNGQVQFDPNGGNYHKVYATAIANAFQKGGKLHSLYQKYTPDAYKTIIGGTFSMGKGLWNLNKKLRGAHKADQEAKGKKFDSESGTWVAKDAQQGESKKEKGKLSKAINGLTGFLKKGKKEKKGGGFFSNLLGGLGLMRVFGGIGKFGRSLLALLPALSLLKPAIDAVVGAFKFLMTPLTNAASALGSFASKAAGAIAEMAGKAWDGIKGMGNKAIDAGKGLIDKGRAGASKAVDAIKSGVGKAGDFVKGAGGKIADVGRGAINAVANVAKNPVGVIKTAGKWALRGAGPVGAVITAGTLGYEGGKILNEKFGLSDKIGEGLRWLGDKSYNLIHNQLSESERMNVAKNPENYSAEKREYAAMSDLMDLKRNYKETGKEMTQKELIAVSKSLRRKYKVDLPDVEINKKEVAELTKSSAKTDLHHQNQKVIEETSKEKAVSERVEKPTPPPAVITNQPITNIYNGEGGSGGSPSMTTRNLDSSYIRNVDGNTSAFAF